MSTPKRQIHLNLFGNWYGNHRGSWRHPSVTPGQVWDLDFNVRVAKMAERGLFDAIFFAGGVSQPSVAEAGGRTTPDALVLHAALASVTERLGLALTINTTYSEPYTVAKHIGSLDQLSRGRAGWNAVTGSQRSAAPNYGPDPYPEPAERYARSEEFIQVVKALWESWDADAVVGDQKSGQFLDPSKVHNVRYKGDFFDLDAVYSVPRSPQGRPLLFHAGDSDFGRNQGAQHADGIFTAQGTIEAGREFYSDFKRRVVAAGRRPEDVLIFPGFLAIVGSTEAEAKTQLAELNELIDIDHAIAEVARTDGLDVADIPLDDPVPDHVWQRSAETSNFKSRVEALRLKALADNLTAREVIFWNVAAHGHYVSVGTPEKIADELQEWFETGAADGFNYKAPIFPDGLEVFVEHVVPELQKRGLYRKEYTGTTLRHHLGLTNPAPTITR